MDECHGGPERSAGPRGSASGAARRCALGRRGGEANNP